MTLKEFIDKWTGQHVDFDGIYPDQCMDLAHQYVYEVLGVKDKSIISAPSAYQVYTNFGWGTLFDKIENTPSAIPESGDLIIWGQEVGPWGHIAVFVEGDLYNFKCFGANWPVGTLPHIENHTYSGVLGWIRFKGISDTDCTQRLEEITQELIDMRSSRNEWKRKYEEFEDKYTDNILEKNKHIEDLQKSLSELNQVNSSLMKDKDNWIAEKEILSSEALEANLRELNLSDKISILKREKDEIRGNFESLNIKLKSCRESLRAKLKKQPIIKLIWAIIWRKK